MRILLLKTDWLADNWNQQIFWSIAVVASLLLVILTVYSLFSEDNESENLSSHDGLFQLDARTVLTFFTAFGWAAAIIMRFDNSIQKALLYGILIGLVTAILTSVKGFPHWVASKNSKTLLESTGKVLQSIPPHRAGTGKIYLDTRRFPTEVNAVTQGRELPVGSPVRVIGMLDDETLLVEPLEDQDHPKPGIDYPSLGN